MKDNRKLIISGNISSKDDIEEVYRELCAHLEFNLSKARSFTDSQKVFNIAGLVKLCLHLNLKITIDAIADTFSVNYPNKGDKPVDVVLDEETTRKIESNFPEAVKEEENGSNSKDFENVNFTEIPKDQIPNDPLKDQEFEDLF